MSTARFRVILLLSALAIVIAICLHATGAIP